MSSPDERRTTVPSVHSPKFWAGACSSSSCAADFSARGYQRTAALVKSRNYGRDLAALQKLLPPNLRYAGLIGPRKRRDRLLNDLLDIGVKISASSFHRPDSISARKCRRRSRSLYIVVEIHSGKTAPSKILLDMIKTPVFI